MVSMMTDSEKYRIKPLDDKSDYTLWRIRVFAAISAKGLDKVFEAQTDGDKDSTSRDIGCNATDEQCQKASNIIVSTLSDNALRVIRFCIGNPILMMEKLNNRFDSKTIASRISKIYELVTIRYTTLRDDIGKHIDKVAGIIEQLQNMGSKFDNALSIGLLVASIDVHELQPAVAAIKTLSEKDVNWETVSARLIEEVTNLKSGNRNRANAVTQGCGICGKPNHTTDRCFFNPRNPKKQIKSKIR